MPELTGSRTLHLRGRVVLVVVLVIGATAVGGWYAWVARAQTAAEQVVITAEAVRGCSPRGALTTSERVLVVGSPGSSCLVRITIANGSRRTVELRSMDVGLLRAEEQPSRIVEVARDQPDTAVSSIRDGDVALGDVLEPGHSVRHRLVLDFNPEYCNGLTIDFSSWPSATVGVGGRTFAVGAATGLTLERGRGLPEDGLDCGSG